LISSITNGTLAHYHLHTSPSCESVRKSGHGLPFAPEDTVSISKEARNLLKNDADDDRIFNVEKLTEQEQKDVQSLKQRDAEVKAHEMAHVVAGGGVVKGGAHYQYESGPDGKRYAVGGHVNIDVSPENDPEGTIRKMQQVKKAALAPAKPSATDRAVAAKAARLETEARSEMREEQAENAETVTNHTAPSEEPIENAPEATGFAPGGVTSM
jgi:hypothetical protein